jgi:hypothetical protein
MTSNFTFCSGPANGAVCYRLVYSATTKHVDNCDYSSGFTVCPVINGERYSLALFDTYQEFLDFNTAQGTDFDINNFPYLDTTH